MALPIKTRIEYYEDDIRRWEESLNRIGGNDPLIESFIAQLKDAVKTLKEELENGNNTDL